MTVERLNFSQPPNGYLVWFDDGWSCVCWGLEDDGQAINTSDDNLTEESATAAAWAHHKARHDPPGMNLLGGFFCSPRTNPKASEARAAAWVWYERRAALEELRCRIGVDLLPDQWWPRCLSWSDNQVAAVEYWLDEGGDVPEVLRG